MDLTFLKLFFWCTSAVLVSVLTVKNGWRQSASEQDPIPWYVVSEISMRYCYGTVTAWEVTAGVSGRGCPPHGS